MGARIGTFFELGGRGAMECLTRAGLDFVIIDAEHGCFSVESAAELVLAAENGGLEPYVRIGDARRPSVLGMLDIGARGLIVPNIRTVDQAREVVRHAKFPPLGQRGFCPNRTSGWGADAWARDLPGYMAECNRRCKVIPQCETREALERIEEIAALPGVDGVFVGPFDLSIELGIPFRFDDPALIRAIERILAACKNSGKESFIFAGDMDNALKWTKRGFDAVACGLDADVFIRAYRALVGRYREGLEEET